jgi:hypothetical protein
MIRKERKKTSNYGLDAVGGLGDSILEVRNGIDYLG